MNEPFEAVENNEHADHREEQAPDKVHESVTGKESSVFAQEYLHQEKERIREQEGPHVLDFSMEGQRQCSEE